MVLRRGGCRQWAILMQLIKGTTRPCSYWRPLRVQCAVTGSMSSMPHQVSHLYNLHCSEDRKQESELTSCR